MLIDSSKQTSLPWCLRRSPGIDLRVIHCVRDSRGVAASWAKATKRPEAVSAEHELMPQFSPARISSWWTVHNTAIEPIGRRLPAIRMRYEDFVSDPRRSTRRMLDLAGVDARWTTSPRARSSCGETHSCAGNPMRFRQGEIALVADERWRQEMAPGARRTVTALTAPLLRHYGYAL